jgi:hypothetical protein
MEKKSFHCKLTAILSASGKRVDMGQRKHRLRTSCSKWDVTLQACI